MDDLENNIPTLTDISHHGNADMLNHFDAHQFDDETEEAEKIITLENASELENETLLTNSEPLEVDSFDDIPSIKIEDSIISNIETENFSDAMQSVAHKSPDKELDDNDLKEKIDHAVEKALSGIEQQLKEQLYKEFDI